MIQNIYNILQLTGIIIYPLSLMAIVSLAIIIDKIIIYLRYTKLPDNIVSLIETYNFTWIELEQQLSHLPKKNYYRIFFTNIINDRNKPIWWIESHAQDQSLIIQQNLSRSLWTLETIVTAAPLLGLLGTINGMMDAFKLIGNNSLVNPTGITGGVAQALIATAIGLTIALICLFSFNYCSNYQEKLMDKMERLGNRLINHIRTKENEIEKIT